MSDEVTIYHNPRCSKSRAALELLNQRGLKVNTVEYTKSPISREVLQEVLGQLQIGVRDLMRRGESTYKALKLGDDSLSEDQLIDAMLENPNLIERPIVVYDGRAAIGRPIDNIINLLDN